MMKLKFFGLTLSTLVTTLLVTNINSKALAVTFKIMGTFDGGGGTLSGTFDFDDSNDTFTNFNLSTFDSSSNIVASYIDSFGDTYLSGANTNGFVISSSTPEFDFDLAINFDGTLTNNTTSLSLLNSFEEDYINNTTRSIISGTVSQVPEPLTILGTATALGMGTLLKRKTKKVDKSIVS